MNEPLLKVLIGFITPNIIKLVPLDVYRKAETTVDINLKFMKEREREGEGGRERERRKVSAVQIKLNRCS